MAIDTDSIDDRLRAAYDEWLGLYNKQDLIIIIKGLDPEMKNDDFRDYYKRYYELQRKEN